jgi:hypothetical protein
MMDADAAELILNIGYIYIFTDVRAPKEGWGITISISPTHGPAVAAATLRNV